MSIQKPKCLGKVHRKMVVTRYMTRITENQSCPGKESRLERANKLTALEVFGSILRLHVVYKKINGRN